MKRFATKQPLWHRIWQRHAGFGLHYLTEKFTRCLNLFLPPCVQRTISQCNIIVYFSSSHWAATASPTGRDELFTSCLRPRHCHHLALCNENRPWAPQAEIHKLFQECRDTCTLPCPWVICARNRKAWLHCTVCSYVALQLSHKRVGAALRCAVVRCAGGSREQGPVGPSCWTRLPFSSLSIVVTPVLCPLQGSASPCCSIAKGGSLMGFNKIPVPSRSLGEVYMSACPTDGGPWLMVSLSLS